MYYTTPARRFFVKLSIMTSSKCQGLTTIGYDAFFAVDNVQTARQSIDLGLAGILNQQNALQRINIVIARFLDGNLFGSGGSRLI